MENETLLPETNAATIFYTLASLTLVFIGLIYLEGILKPLVIAYLFGLSLTGLNFFLTGSA